MSSASGVPQPPQHPPHQGQAIPTYEIVTNAVVFSGYYYTPYVHQQQNHHHHQDPTTVHHVAHAGAGQHHHQAAFTMTPGQCLPCSCNQWAAAAAAQQLSQPQQS